MIAENDQSSSDEFRDVMHARGVEPRPSGEVVVPVVATLFKGPAGLDGGDRCRRRCALRADTASHRTDPGDEGVIQQRQVTRVVTCSIITVP